MVENNQDRCLMGIFVSYFVPMQYFKYQGLKLALAATGTIDNPCLAHDFSSASHHHELCKWMVKNPLNKVGGTDRIYYLTKYFPPLFPNFLNVNC